MRKGNLIHKWNRPEEIDREVSRLFLKTGMDMLPRLILVVGVILLCLYLLIRHIVPQEVFPPIRRGIIGSFFFAQFLPCGFILMGLIRRYLRTKYEVYENKIITGDLFNTNTVLWQEIRGYSYLEREAFPNVISIKLHGKGTKNKILSMPEGDMSEGVIRTVGERCAFLSQENIKRPIKFIPTKSEQVYALIVTLVYSGIAGYLVHKQLLGFSLAHTLLLTLIVGPGTLACLLLYGGRTVRDKGTRAFALLFNFSGTVLLALFWTMLELYYWSNIIKDLSEQIGVPPG